MNKYPVYIVSKGRYEKTYTADFLIKDGVKFLIAVEEIEYNKYVNRLGKEYVLKLPFSNLGVGSYPARNYCWEHSIKNGFDKHWLFDDNIRHIGRFHLGERIQCNALKALGIVEDFSERYENLAITGLNYMGFIHKETKPPYVKNTHIYSGMLIKNDIKFRWRLKYNEDVDLTLQVLDSGLCTVLLNTFYIAKISTVTKLKGGNQTELYLNNAEEKKILKACSLNAIWPQYAETKIRFKRPHHYVNWKKHFKQRLIRRKDIDWDKILKNKYDFELKQIGEIKSKELQEFYLKNKNA